MQIVAGEWNRGLALMPKWNKLPSQTGHAAGFDTIMKKTILITGTSTGFGKTTARHFAGQGWNVIATLRRPEEEQELTKLPDTLVARLDVQDPESIAMAIEAGIGRFGRIDALVNNAGFGLFGLFEATPLEKIAEQFEVNVFGVMNVTRAILPHFRRNKGGIILNIGSGAGVFALPMVSLYCATKFALEGFTEALSYELASQNIIVKMIEPGGVVSTKFGQRSGVEAAQNAALPDYDGFVAQANAFFADLRASRRATEEDVAKVIYDAATDGKDRLRYVATEDIQPLVKARRETSEEEYMAFMRSRFRTKAKSSNP
jgi:NAD(P)-dependent dehydrogenase (short-subunit alcohol dehydrogenase family)